MEANVVVQVERLLNDVKHRFKLRTKSEAVEKLEHIYKSELEADPGDVPDWYAEEVVKAHQENIKKRKYKVMSLDELRKLCRA